MPLCRHSRRRRSADWNDLNDPARTATLAAAGLPMIQKYNAGARVAIQAPTS
jgi:hypothetical protein